MGALQRMDLMRAVIVGAAGTPYHNYMFVFDISLPSDYPASPPSLHYHSWGLRVNPNLYENGKVGGLLQPASWHHHTHD